MKVIDSLALGLNELTGGLSQDRRVTPPTAGEIDLKQRFVSTYAGELTDTVHRQTGFWVAYNDLVERILGNPADFTKAKITEQLNITFKDSWVKLPSSRVNDLADVLSAMAEFAVTAGGLATTTREKALSKLEKTLRKAEVRYTIPETVFKRLGAHGTMAALVGGALGLFLGHFWSEIPFHQTVEEHSGLAFLAFRGPYELYKFYGQTVPLVPYLKTDLPKMAKWAVNDGLAYTVSTALFLGAAIMGKSEYLESLPYATQAILTGVTALAGAAVLASNDTWLQRSLRSLKARFMPSAAQAVRGDALLERDVTDEVSTKVAPAASESLSSAWGRFRESAVMRSEVITKDFDGSFRSAFLPSVLVASGVLAAGIDLESFLKILSEQPELALFLQVYYISKGIQMPLAAYAMAKPYVAAESESETHVNRAPHHGHQIETLQRMLSQDPAHLTSHDMSALLAHRRLAAQQAQPTRSTLPLALPVHQQAAHASASVSWKQRVSTWHTRNLASARAVLSRVTGRH